MTIQQSFFAIGNFNAESSFVFTTGGATGRLGPSLSNFQSSQSYATQSWFYDGSFSVTNGIQSWTVQKTGIYRITANGACGGPYNNYYTYNGDPGKGASIQGDFSLNAGDILNIVVGQIGISGLYGSGGGGGSFVYTGSIGDNGLLIAAGGGGGWGHGSANFPKVTGGDGNSLTNSTSGTSSPGTEDNKGTGQGGYGTQTSSYGGAGGGTGWLSVGENSNVSSYNGYGGQRFQGGLSSSNTTSDGGFGGGGGGGGNGIAGGGGGGYTGGGAGKGWNGISWGAGGGGGSYNSGTNQINVTGGNGLNVGSVILSLLN